MQDELGDRMKTYEAISNHVVGDVPYVCIRLDGRGFSKFTRGMSKPFDTNMILYMQQTTKLLVKEFKPLIAYTQSDEISLLFDSSKLMFAGKIQKLTSISASFATAVFNSTLPHNPRNRYPHFDSRVIKLPNEHEAVNCILWRVKDAQRNAVSMYAQSLFSHKELQHKSTDEMLQMIYACKHKFHEIIPDFRYGSFFKRVMVVKTLTADDDAVVAGYAKIGDTALRSEIQRVLASREAPTFVTLRDTIFNQD